MFSIHLIHFIIRFIYPIHFPHRFRPLIYLTIFLSNFSFFFLFSSFSLWSFFCRGFFYFLLFFIFKFLSFHIFYQFREDWCFCCLKFSCWRELKVLNSASGVYRKDQIYSDVFTPWMKERGISLLWNRMQSYFIRFESYSWRN